MLKLYAHNADAYEKAVAMMKRTGKACVIHPTGTGKSFIAFKLCADFPDKKVLWLGPSNYIFRTQRENWEKAGGESLKNITFLTYARLMMMEEDEIASLEPDQIVLDEFHRCGAQQWGRGVSELLKACPQVPLLGLSATNIRYLDRQRDMAEELFEGNVASEMTLAEAIVRGILYPPKYVLSMYSYKEELERYEARIRNTKSAAARRAAEEYYEAIRRRLEHAEGMDRIFAKHLPDKEGRYLVFCSGSEHMDEMIARVPEWFGSVDAEPHVYRVYSEDSRAEEEFTAFKEDESAHIKLLFCIDMLNEGVHVEGVNGVVLLRPTISPVVFKQQIGRALSASRRKEAVIFDVVQNIENLYSISTMQEEMQAAITYYRYGERREEIVNEAFRVVDETRDIRQMFNELEMKLGAGWELMYEAAARYYEAHGNLMIPARYKTDDGLSLGSWLNTQRKIYTGKVEGSLTDAQVEKLNRIGIVWDSYSERSWEKGFAEAGKYFREHGDLEVPARYVTESGYALGVWISRMRAARANARSGLLGDDRIRRLEEIGMCWDAMSSQWEKNYLEAAAYFREHGNLMVPEKYVSPSGIKLGNWIVKQRQIRREQLAGHSGRSGILSDEQIRRLELIGMAWDAEEERWQQGVSEARMYAALNGNLDVPAAYVTQDGYALGNWINLKRRQYRKGTLPERQIAELELLGMRWDVRAEQWQEMYDSACKYYEINGNLRIPRSYKAENGRSLGVWVSGMKQKKDHLSVGQVEKLEKIGMVW